MSFKPFRYLKTIFLLANIWSATLGCAYAEEVIVNPDVHQEAISRNALRAIFGMRIRTWPDGTPITVFILRPPNPVHTAFCKTQLTMFPHQLERAWDRLVYSGTGQAPIEVDSLKQMLTSVAETPGAIGYMADESLSGKVRKLKVD
jgi:ABC-type phosphate transport system substrate-binding protein